MNAELLLLGVTALVFANRIDQGLACSCSFWGTCQSSSSSNGGNVLEVTVPPASLNNVKTPPPETYYATSYSIEWGTCGVNAYGGLEDDSSELQRSLPARRRAGSSRVLGGVTTKPHEIPWQARLNIVTSANKTFLCGGSIITDQWVVTAAHCIIDDSRIVVIAGGHTLAREYLDAVQIRAIRTVQHPLYNAGTGDFDIALIQLEDSLNFDNVIQPACIPKSCSIDCAAGSSAIISGWGTIAETSSRPTAALQKATVSIVTPYTCQQGFNANNISRQVTARMVCAGVASGSVDTCKGDDGGPLSCKPSGSDRYYLSGVKSFVDKCGTPGVYSTYIRPCQVIKWLNEITGSSMNYGDLSPPETTLAPTDATTHRRPTKRTTTTATTATTKPPVTTSPTPSPTNNDNWVNDPNCGKSKYSDAGQFTSRIVGGSVTRNNEFPWQVRIITVTSQGSSYICGGSLISNQWVVTAAHCIASTEVQGGKSTIYLGSQKMSTAIDGELVIPAQLEIPHPEYNDDTHDYDIALMKLNRTVAYSDQIRPICMLPASCSGEAATGTGCSISGWGTVVEGGYSASEDLRKALVPTVSIDDCKNGFNDAGYDGSVITIRNVCAGDIEGGVDTCQGDSGGPLACKNAAGQFYLNGITSYGYGCARQGLYGVYARTCKLMDWVIATTAAN